MKLQMPSTSSDMQWLCTAGLCMCLGTPQQGAANCAASHCELRAWMFKFVSGQNCIHTPLLRIGQCS